ncbi:N-acetylmuramoyl-L-alanine amidase [Lysinibacillus contaminans]|uniref:N-acetylmuramoyl-L-alanine amidase n=1 Tax=Lysinibacillus contaminans TaxID=1293441 RepID=UPI0006AE6991|nr:N-acetylmuramoyl-L-alanine amidase [Lysinibacillus contaminans]
MITISPGHWRIGSGAKDIIDEVGQARRVVDRVAQLLTMHNVPTTKIEDNVSQSQSENLRYLIRQHNATKRKVDVSIHFNASNGRMQKGIGTEVLYYDALSLATTMSKGISDASGLKNRGAKQRKELTFLRDTKMPAILIEVCFVNSMEDVKCYEQHFEAICTEIASVLAKFVGFAWNDDGRKLAFSTIALTEKVDDLLKDNEWKRQVIDKGIEMDAFSPVWRTRQVNDLDFLGLCAMLAKKII